MCGEAFIIGDEYYKALVAQWKDDDVDIVEYETLGGGHCAFRTSHIAHLERVTEDSAAQRRILLRVDEDEPQEPWKG